MDRLETGRAQREAIRQSAARNSAVTPPIPTVSRYLRAQAALSTYPAAANLPVDDMRPAATLAVAARRRVLVGVDDSAGGYLAVEQAAREASWRGWPLRIVHVQDAVWGTHRRDVIRTAAAQLLADGADRARALQPDVAVSTTALVGSPAGELVAASHDAGLVVLGTRGLGGFADLLAGSVAVHVATSADAPVLILRVPPRSVGLEWIEHPILVGVDGSTAGYAAFEFAVAEARLRGVGILVVHADLEPSDSPDDPLHADVLAGFDTHCLGVQVHRRWVAKDPRRALVGLSAHASAVVVGARGRGGFPGLHSGSVAQALIHQAHSPVFIVHAMDRDI